MLDEVPRRLVSARPRPPGGNLAGNEQVHITAAANEIDRLIAEDPLSIGQVRTNLIRFLAEGPLGVYYEVSEADMQVRVRAVFRVPG